MEARALMREEVLEGDELSKVQLDGSEEQKVAQ